MFIEARKAQDNDDDNNNNSEDSEDSEEEDSKLPGAKDTLPTKEKSANHSFQDHATETLSDNLSKMSIATAPFSLDVKFPYLMYTYKEDDRDRVTYDFLVVAQAQDQYRPLVPAGGTELHIGMVLPKFFIDKTRLLDAKQGDAAFTGNTHKVTSFQDIVEKVEKSVGIDDDNRDSEGMEFLAAPMKLKTPFPVEEEILDWEMQAFQNGDDTFIDNCGGYQYYFILTVTLQSVVKKKEKKAGGFRVIASPSRDRDGMEEEQKDDL